MASLNRNPGKKAKKNMDTLGFKTFITNPCLNSCDTLFFGIESLPKLNSPLDLYTLYAKNNKYKAPNNFIMKYNLSLSLIIADTPNATNDVCTKQPVIKPATVANPYFLPFTILCIKTYMLSGPGDNANADVAIINDISRS